MGEKKITRYDHCCQALGAEVAAPLAGLMADGLAILGQKICSLFHNRMLVSHWSVDTGVEIRTEFVAI